MAWAFRRARSATGLSKKLGADAKRNYLQHVHVCPLRSPQVPPESAQHLSPAAARGPAPPHLGADDELLLHPGVLSGNSGWMGVVTTLSIVTTTVKLAALTPPGQLPRRYAFCCHVPAGYKALGGAEGRSPPLQRTFPTIP
ncbi:hypothetical protein MAPG_08788 [Magnaporthiopsis poae ATCC 64411]|uniref:Uncharacterized protein n=1 Tax=Magnaporthiopsis poae (strain ATCC 64411 / 73-15) TaxID=644358 RepID=A0A0C4E891_MAGP6|nr:hypothetical protein MAPG_08788 [Magnaporthiopsis poae ATCC 64411]